MRRDVVTSAIAVVVLTALLGLAYPLLITGVGQVAFPGNANGQRVYVDGRLVGSKIIGQSFREPVLDKHGREEAVTEADPEYFESRPSATEAAPTTRPQAPSPTAARTTRRPSRQTPKTSRPICGWRSPMTPD